MRRLFTFFSASLSLIVMLQAQSEFNVRRKNVDSLVSTLNLKSIRDLDLLSDTLTCYFTTDSEKVRAIYFWLAENIAYDWRYYKKVQSLTSIHLPKGMDYEDYVWMRMEKTIARKRGICSDYAHLFAYLCKRAKIPCLEISGYAASHRVSILMMLDQEETNHAWNVVRVNDRWYPVDVTWASGLFAKGKKIRKVKRNDFYYLTRPEEFIKDHRPIKNQWQLLGNNSVGMREFIRIANKEIRKKIPAYFYWTPF